MSRPASLYEYLAKLPPSPALSKAGGGDPVQQVVEMAGAAEQIMQTVREESARAKEAARNDNNEFNIAKNFLDNAVNSIHDATYGQFNIVICTDQAHDDFQDLTGQILPMDLIDVEVAQGKVVNFQVYVFDTGKYLRHGKWERDHWWWWGASKTWTDPAAMHVHFEKAQPKLDADAIKKKIDDEAKAKDVAAAAVSLFPFPFLRVNIFPFSPPAENSSYIKTKSPLISHKKTAAAATTQVQASASQAQSLQIDAQSQAQDASYIYGAKPGETQVAQAHAPMSFTNRELFLFFFVCVCMSFLFVCV